MNIAQLQLALGPLGSPAAAEKPDLAGYEAQGELPARVGSCLFLVLQAQCGHSQHFIGAEHGAGYCRRLLRKERPPGGTRG